MIDFGAQLKSIRKSRGVTQKKLANAIGASERGIQHYELNEREPSLSTLLALANYFNVSIDYLVGRTDNPKGGVE